MMVRLLVPWVEELPIQAAALSSCLTEMKRIMKYGDDDFWANMENTEEMLVDAAKNAEAYAERIQFLDDKSLSLIMWEAADDVRGALKILRDYYQDKGKPHIINLYTDLTSLQKSDSESVTEYVICTETTITTQLWGHRGDVGCSNRWQRDEGSYAVATERETRQGRWPGSREGSSRTGVFQMQKEETVQRPRRSCKVSGETEDQDKQYIFQVSEGSAGVSARGLMVDCGGNLTYHHRSCQVQEVWWGVPGWQHCVELANGMCKGVAERRSDAEVCLIDSRGRHLSTTLRQALYIASYPQEMFSVKAATASGATMIFKKGKDVLIHRDGTKFHIHVHDRLYYLHTANNEDDDCGDQCRGCFDTQTWHEILGHCNQDDIQRLQSVDGMKSEVCTPGRFFQTRNRDPDVRAKTPLELVHTDLAG